MILDIGIGNRPRGDVNLDVWANPLCNIMGDIQHLPIKTGVVAKILCSQVIEHLDNPNLALSEIKRAMRNDGVAHIDVPKPEFTNNSKYYLMWFIFNFPISLIPKSLRLISRKLSQIKRRDGWVFHKHIISKESVKQYFEIDGILEIGDILYSFLNYGKKSRYFRNKPRINTAYLFVCRRGETDNEN